MLYLRQTFSVGNISFNNKKLVPFVDTGKNINFIFSLIPTPIWRVSRVFGDVCNDVCVCVCVREHVRVCK